MEMLHTFIGKGVGWKLMKKGKVKVIPSLTWKWFYSSTENAHTQKFSGNAGRRVDRPAYEGSFLGEEK